MNINALIVSHKSEKKRRRAKKKIECEIYLDAKASE